MVGITPMFTSRTKIWNDGPDLIDFMGRDDAPAVARRHLCSGGGGGSTPQAPDYSQYISKMTEMGEQGMTWAKDLFGWAQSTGVDLMSLAKTVSGKAGAAADTQQASSDQLMKDWYGNTADLYKAQSDDARRMIKDMPGTEERYAGKFSADTAQAMDAAKNTQMRNMRAQGFSPSAVATQAIDTTAGLQRATALTAAGEAGRMAARTEGRGVTQTALNTNAQIPGVAATEAGLATGNRNQQFGTPNAAAGTSASLYSPAANFYGASFPYMQQWGSTMGQSYRDQMAQNQSDDGSGDWGALAGTVVGTGVGAYFGGPMGASVGGSVGGKLGGAADKAATGGRIRGRRYANGGAIDTAAPMGGESGLVPPEASPSGGAEVDDVHAMVSEGEFVIPKRTVDWLGDKFFQKLIMKTDSEMEQDTVAEPEAGPPMAAMDTSAPMFRSEGARV